MVGVLKSVDMFSGSVEEHAVDKTKMKVRNKEILNIFTINHSSVAPQ